MYGTSSMETPPIDPRARWQRPQLRYRITNLHDHRHVVVEADDVADAIAPWYRDRTADDLTWISEALTDLQEALLRDAPARLYATVLAISIIPVPSGPSGDIAPWILTHEPCHRGAHLRDRRARIWRRTATGWWRAAHLPAQLTWGDLQREHGPLTNDGETLLLEQLARAAVGSER